MQRPFIFINSAMSADGKTSSILRKQVRISGKDDLARVDELRASSDAIMVGVETILADDPSLRVKSERLRKYRLERGSTEYPMRIIADSRARTPEDSKVLGSGCLVAVSRAAKPDRLARLNGKCEIVICGEQRVDLRKLMDHLSKRGIRRLMVEGGATLNWGMIDARLVDEIYVFIGDMLIGGKTAPSLVDGAGFCDRFPKLELISLDRIDGGALVRWRVLPSLPSIVPSVSEH